MNENLELMMHVYKTSEMGAYSTNSLLEKLQTKENKIKHVLECEIKEYEKFMKESEKILTENDVEPKRYGLMSKMSSDMGIAMETLKDNSDPALAQMLIEGFTMGTVEMNNKIKKYKSTCEKRMLKIAKNFLKFQENEIEKLKTFM